MESIINAVSQKAEEAAKICPNDYVKDGLMHCGFCGTPKQTRITLPWNGQERIVYCLCQCQIEEQKAEEAEKKAAERMKRIQAMRINGIADENIRAWNFDADDGESELTKRARKYVSKWEEMFKQNIGIMFLGGVGNGKSFAAACIVNYLIDKGIPAMMTNLPTIMNGLFSATDKNAYLRSLNEYDLLVIDDLGVERQSEYSLEQVFSVIDARYRAGKPLIVTTNLELSEIENAQNIKLKRIYDRISEMCMPIKAEGGSRRKKALQSRLSLLD